MSRKIYVDEHEPLKDVDDYPFEPRDVYVRSDKWVTDEYQIFEMLGKGKFGEVKRCKEIVSGRELAAKFIATPTPQDVEDVHHEVKIMKRLQHKRLLQLYDAFQIRNMMCLVLEVILGGELFDRVICDDFVLTENACVCIVRQMLEGVAHMHKHNIIHLDMKPENILCLTRTGNRVKIIDFGLARFYDERKELRVLFGTPEFMAPEVVNYEPITFATDMWSIGVICYVLLSGLSPFMGDADGDTLTNVIKGEYDFNYKEFDDVSEAAKDMIEKLLVIDKRKRLTAEQCLQHPWLKRMTPPQSPVETQMDLTKESLKRYVYRKRWQKSFRALVKLKKMGIDIEYLVRTNTVYIPGKEPPPAKFMTKTPCLVPQAEGSESREAFSEKGDVKSKTKSKKDDAQGGLLKKSRGFDINRHKDKMVSKVQSFGLVFGASAKKKDENHGVNKVTCQSDSNKENGPVGEAPKSGMRKKGGLECSDASDPHIAGGSGNGEEDTKPSWIKDRFGERRKKSKPPIPPKPGTSANKPGLRKWQKGNDRYIVVNKVQDAIKFFTVDDRRELNHIEDEKGPVRNRKRDKF